VRLPTHFGNKIFIVYPHQNQMANFAFQNSLILQMVTLANGTAANEWPDIK
jgi:hypothetical protein